MTILYTIMRHFSYYLFALLFTISTFCYCIPLYSQNASEYKYSTSIKKGTEESVRQAISAYFTSLPNHHESNHSDVYDGHIEDFVCGRSGINRSSYSIDYTVSFDIIKGKGYLSFLLKSIKESRTVCDLSQRKEELDISMNSIPQVVSDAFKDVSKNIADNVWAFLKKGEKSALVLQKKPVWFDLSYIVEPHSVSYFSIIRSQKNLSKEALYKIFENYFTYAYRSGKAVIENKNPDDCSIIAKGIYKEIHNWGNQELYDVSHIINIQCRDGRARVSFTLDDYDIRRVHTSAFVPDPHFTRNVVDYEPFGKEKDKEMEECLEKLEMLILAQFRDMQKAIDEGNTVVEALDNW